MSERGKGRDGAKVQLFTSILKTVDGAMDQVCSRVFTEIYTFHFSRDQISTISKHGC
jgi:hypothetical protein